MALLNPQYNMTFMTWETFVDLNGLDWHVNWIQKAQKQPGEDESPGDFKTHMARCVRKFSEKLDRHQVQCCEQKISHMKAQPSSPWASAGAMRVSPGPTGPGAGGEMPGSPVTVTAPQDEEAGQLLENDGKWRVKEVPPPTWLCSTWSLRK